MATTRKIRNTIISFTIVIIAVSILLLGIAIQFTFNHIYREQAQSELAYTSDIAEKKWNDAKTSLARQSKLIAEQPLIVAMTHLVNRYQDPKQYQPLVFDGDKKRVAQNLLQQITISDLNAAAIYDNDGQLIVYAVQYRDDHDIQIAGIVSYDDANPVYLARQPNWEQWQPHVLDPFTTRALAKSAHSGTTCPSLGFRQHQKDIVIESGSPIFNLSATSAERETLGCVVSAMRINSDFFSAIASAPLTNLQLIRNIEQPSLELQEDDEHYFRLVPLAAEQKSEYLRIEIHKLPLISILNDSLSSLIFVFLAVISIAIALAMVLVNRTVVRPLTSLIDTVKRSDQPSMIHFPVDRHDNEISELGRVLNSMVETIKTHEEEQQENKRELIATQRLAKLGSWQLNVTTREVECSDETYFIFEMDPKKEKMTLDKFYDNVHPEDRERLRSAFYESLKSSTPFDFTYRRVRKDGSIKILRAYCKTHLDNSDEPIIAHGMVQDITEIANKDEQLRRSQKMDALGKLTGGIAHDFNNLLNVIIGFSSLVKSTAPAGASYAAFIDEVIKAGERAAKLTRKLLAFSRRETSSAEIAELNQILRDELNLIQKTLTVRINVQLQLDESLWPVWIESNEFRDALLNMCINSMHAMNGKGTLTIQTFNVDAAHISALHLELPQQDHVVVSITDTGCGMDENTIQRIFEPFFTTKKQSGTGLGLSQVYGFVQRSQGKIDVKSAIGKGTTITIYFPRLTNVEDKLKEVKPSFKQANLGGSETILVVDDEQQLRDLHQKSLSDIGYKVLCAGNAEEALNLLEKENVDLMLSDVIMPGMDGYELAALVQKRYPQVIIQMMSGHAENTQQNAASGLLHQQRLVKPVGIQQIAERIRQLLEDKKLNPQKARDSIT